MAIKENRKKLPKLLGISVLILIVLMGFNNDAYAVTISPLRYSIGVDPGEKQVMNINVINDSDSIQTYKPSVSGFTLDEDLGFPLFDQDTEAVRWLSAEPESLTLRPGEESTFIFTVAVPAYSKPKVHYLGLLAEEQKNDGQIQISPRVGTLLFLYVGGTYQEDLTREKFSINKKFQFHSDITLSLGLKNNGNIHAIPRGQITIKNIMGTIVAQFEINKNERKIIPQQSWHEEFTTRFKEFKAIGPLKAELEIDYGLTNQKIYAETSWWMLPWHFLVGVGALVLGLVMLIGLFLKMAHKKKSKK